LGEGSLRTNPLPSPERTGDLRPSSRMSLKVSYSRWEMLVAVFHA
jgi:hypothetical protein